MAKEKAIYYDRVSLYTQLDKPFNNQYTKESMTPASWVNGSCIILHIIIA